MKKAIIIITLLISAADSYAQLKTIETTAIEKTINNYIENFFENNFDLMNESLHPRLAKRGLNLDSTLSDDFPPEKLKELMMTKQKFEVKHQNNVVEDIIIYGDMASASLRTGYPNLRWTEYIHLVKQDGDWKIINVFWEYEKVENKKH
ncbi:MAG: nuclear transport factor 2 family protein [Polaribacter sp.]|uniref:nuclear transport factor 2 family protein n=1 Tax=Polaribacter sp. TaxID=1920175 RepID=UPI003BB1A54B